MYLFLLIFMKIIVPDTAFVKGFQLKYLKNKNPG